MHHPIARFDRVIVVLAALLVTLLFGSSIAHAHTDLDSSTPADGDAVDAPVGEITVAFTQPVTLVGGAFEVLDPQGNLLEPAATSDDDTVFRLLLDEPLVGGAVGVRYTVTAADGHVVSGTFSFTVPDVAVTTMSAPTTVATSSVPTTAVDVALGATEPPVTSAAPTGAPDDADDPEQVTAADVEPEVAGLPADGGTSTSVWLALAVAVVIGIGGFLLLRSRTLG